MIKKTALLFLAVSMFFLNGNTLAAKGKPLSGQDENGNRWVYDRKTKTLTFSGTKDLEYFELNGYNPEPEWFCWNNEAEHLVIESGITGLPGEEFRDFYKLKTAELPDTVTSIGDAVFRRCRGIETVRMPENLTSIGALAFDGCASLKSIWIPEHVRTIGWCAFSGCDSIKEIEIPEKVTKIGSCAFGLCDNLESVRLPDNLKTVEASLFYDCRKLSEIRLPDSVKRIEREAFGCSGITHIEIPKNVTGFYKGEDSYGSPGIFQDCKKLKEITIRSEKLGHVFKGAFDRMDKNTVIKVPKSCLKKYKKLFKKAGLDKSVRMEAIDETERPLSGKDRNGNTWTYDRETKTLAFAGTADLEKYTPEREPGWSVWYRETEHVVVHDGITGLPGGNFRLFYRLVTAELPESVVSVGDYAFYGCKELETITIPKNTAYIGKMAFADCYRLKEAVLPEGITSIGKRAFSGCEELGGIKLPDSVEKIGPYAFSECRSLASVRLPGKLKTVEEGVFFQCRDLAEVNLPDSLKKIKKNAFSESGITRIVVPKNVTGFYEDKKGDCRDGVFECCEGLKEITIKSKKLEHVYEGAFQGMDKNTVIKVPKSCLKKYKKMFRKAGLDKKIKVKAISGGVNSGSAKLHSAVKKAYNKGILLAAAAGNGGKKNGFTEIKYYKKCSTAEKYSNNASNSKVQEVISRWKK